MSQQVNDHLVLIAGMSSTGKSASLMNLRDPEGVMYLNCEAGKRLPFPAKFLQATVTDPLQVPDAIQHAETLPHIHTIVVDTLTFLLEMYESLYIHGAADGRAAWGNFAQFFKDMMQQKVAASSKKVVFMAHTLATYNESELIFDVKVPVKGALKNQGIEAFFSQVISTKKMKLKDLADYKSDMLTITPDDLALGFKYVYQTRLTKDTVAERMRGPIGLFQPSETYINNDLQLVLDRLDQYYK